jgi:hypothetical protein
MSKEDVAIALEDKLKNGTSQDRRRGGEPAIRLLFNTSMLLRAILQPSQTICGSMREIITGVDRATVPRF